MEAIPLHKGLIHLTTNPDPLIDSQYPIVISSIVLWNVIIDLDIKFILKTLNIKGQLLFTKKYSFNDAIDFMHVIILGKESQVLEATSIIIEFPFALFYRTGYYKEYPSVDNISEYHGNVSDDIMNLNIPDNHIIVMDVKKRLMNELLVMKKELVKSMKSTVSHINPSRRASKSAKNISEEYRDSSDKLKDIQYKIDGLLENISKSRDLVPTHIIR